MAETRKGWRRISVQNRLFFWRAIGTDGDILLVVVTESAFRPGQTGQKILIRFDYDPESIPDENRPGFTRTVHKAITPRSVRLAIEESLKPEIAFTGEPNQPDVLLSPETIRKLQEAARSIRPEKR